MSSDPNVGGSWERVAAELRACREAQRRAWGDIDNATLGRFLAGEVSPQEQQHVEQALESLPELRKLTELVRDVLGESEAAIIPYGPATMPLSTEPLRPPVPFIRPAQTTKPRRRWPTARGSHWRQHVGMAAAAATLLFLGVALPSSTNLPASESEPEFVSAAVAMRDDAPEPNVTLLAPPAPAMRAMAQANPLPMPSGALRMATAEDTLFSHVDASLQALEADGKTSEARRMARHYASNWTRQARVYQQNGDLDRAEPALSQACQICTKTFGPEAPETIRTRHNLANVYEIVLNAPPTPTFTYGPAQSAMRKHADLAQAYQMSQPNQGHPNAPVDPVRSASAYRSATPSRAAKANHAPMASAKASAPAPIPNVALRERLTRQTQNELKTSVVPVLTQAFREATDAREIQRLACALGQLGPAARAAVPALLARFEKATDDSERATLLLTFGQIGPAARPALPVLVSSIQSDNPRIRECAARALVAFGPAAQECVRDLAQKSESDPLIREVVLQLATPQGRCGIVDEAECFSVRTIQHARDQVRALAETTQLEVRIHTIGQQKDAPEARAAIEKQMCEKGVYLCIDKDDSQVRIIVSAGLRKQGLNEAELRQTLEPYLRRKDFDRGLRAGLRYLADFESKHEK